MKALITAGGHGTRLRPITYTLNKHLIPLAGKPMIFYALEKMQEAGIKDILINVNPGERELPKVIGDGSLWGLKVKFIEQTGGPKGLAHILKIARPYLKDEPFIFYLGDNLVLAELSDLVKKFEQGKHHAFLTLARVPDPQRFGVPEIQDGKIIGVEEKPKEPKSSFAVAGIYIYHPSVLSGLDYLKPSFRQELEISDLHTWLIQQGYSVGFAELTGWWKDTGKPEDLLEGNALILSQMKDSQILGEVESSATIEGKVKIGQGSKISGKSFIRGPAVIGKDCLISNSFIGPFSSVGNQAEIQDSEIEHSIIFDGAKIKCPQKRIVDSLVGTGARITPASDTLPLGHKLIVGSNSCVEL